MMIYATVAQMMLMVKSPMRSIWSISTISIAIVLPPIVLLTLGIQPDKNPIIWLFSTFPWASLEYATTTTIFMTFLGELTVLTLLVFRLTKQLRNAGESNTKALLGHEFLVFLVTNLINTKSFLEPSNAKPLRDGQSSQQAGQCHAMVPIL